MKGAWIKYTGKQLAWIKSNRKLPRREARRLFVKKFRRKDISVENIKALCSRRGWLTGRTGHFPKGSVPFNKGKPCPPGTGGRHRNSRKTQFKKGHQPHNTRFLWHERISKDGYVEISINETNPHTGFERRHVMKHKWRWEKKHGPVPKGHCLKCIDGNRSNTDPNNWELISRAMLPRLGGRSRIPYDHAPAELKPTILAIAKLEIKARAIRRGKEN